MIGESAIPVKHSATERTAEKVSTKFLLERSRNAKVFYTEKIGFSADLGHCAGHQTKGRQETGTSAAIMDSQSVRSFEESGGNKGYDAAKNVPGRKRHLLVDTSRLLLAGRTTPADTSDNRGARELLAGLAPLMPRLELIWADSAFAGEKLRTWYQEWTGWRLEAVPRNTDGPTFEVLPRR